jgi:flagellar hook-length control protein FliK
MRPAGTNPSVHSAAPPASAATNVNSLSAGSGRPADGGQATSSAAPVVGGVAASSPLAAGTAPAATTTPAPAPPTPAQQVVTVLAPVHTSEDGTHEVTIGLEPEGLGTVKATITVSAGQVVVQLGTDNDAARDALRQSLPLLRHELGGDGSSANVLLSHDGQSGGQAFARPRALPGSVDDQTADDETTTAVVGAPAPTSGHIDLHL